MTEMTDNLETVEDFLSEKKTLSLSTCSVDGTPWTSTAPYLVVENKAYLFISSIAEHYANLKNNENVSIMVVEDVANSMNPFILKRATFKSKGLELVDIPEEIWAIWEQGFDKDLLSKLRTMGFKMFELPLTTGRFVTGYGKAFDVTWNEGAWQQEAVTLSEKK